MRRQHSCSSTTDWFCNDELIKQESRWEKEGGRGGEGRRGGRRGRKRQVRGDVPPAIIRPSFLPNFMIHSSNFMNPPPTLTRYNELVLLFSLSIVLFCFVVCLFVFFAYPQDSR